MNICRKTSSILVLNLLFLVIVPAMGMNGDEHTDVYNESSRDLLMSDLLFTEMLESSSESISEYSHYVQEYDQFLGLIQNGEFKPLYPHNALIDSIKLTCIDMQEALPPESGELDLAEYEGQAVMISGYDGGGWIYSARVVDQAGPILTLVVRGLFGQEPQK